MEHASILPILLACGLALDSCGSPKMGTSSPDHLQELSLAVNTQWVKVIQQAARECSSMELRGRISVMGGGESGNSMIRQEFTRPVSAEDADRIRALLPNLRAVETQEPVLKSPSDDPGMACLLYFLDAQGKTITVLEDACLGSDPRTDASDTPPTLRMVLPPADYAAWKKIIPADLKRKHEQGYAAWKRRYDQDQAELLRGRR